MLAVPGMLDPHFDASVVLMFAEAEGDAGVVLNRPTDVPLSAALPAWAALAADPAVVFWGGPVQEEHAVALAVPAPAGTEALGSDVGLLDLRGSPQSAAGGRGVRVFAGYAGWETGQLEAEIADGGWFVVPATADDVLTADPASLWRSVFGRQEGALRRYHTYPDDPGLN